jgi:hypothetical protein
MYGIETLAKLNEQAEQQQQQQEEGDLALALAKAEASRWHTAFDTATAETANVRREYDAFRDQVRDVAIRVAEDEGWCDSGLNEVLRELGLPPKTTTWRVPVVARAEQVVYVEVEAADEDEAVQLAEDLSTSEYEDEIDAYGWSVDEFEVDKYAGDGISEA